MMAMYSIALAALVCIVSGMDGEVVVLKAVRGREARLPCGQGRVFLDGPDSYVLWLKNDKEPLYRFPNEESSRRSGHQLENCVGDGCYDETALVIPRVSEQDGGLYRCRVHHQTSPSIDYVIDVRLVDSPGYPRLYTADGEEVKKGFVGPFSVGANLTLICEVDDDQPDTLVYFRRNGVVIERAHTISPGVLRAEVHVRNMTRDDLDAHYECAAQNADVTEPLSASVVVKMYLAPLSVEIRLNNNVDFEAGLPRVVDCVVIGCVPPASVTWQLGDAPLRPTVHKELHEGNYTMSSLTLAPSLKENGRSLSCQAHNSHLPDLVFAHSLDIRVGYRPVCVTTREDTLGIVTGQAESVTCVVEAFPAPQQFSWTFADSRTLYTSAQSVPGNLNRYTSTLTWVPRDTDLGQLICRATNAFGEQKRACSFALAVGGPPNIPHCVVLRAYPKTVRVQCKKTWDGGRAQTYHLELYDTSGHSLQNATDDNGQFYLPEVADDRNITLLIYATNVRGRSQIRTMHLETLAPTLALATSSEIRAPSWTHWLEVSGMVAMVTLFIALVVIVTMMVKNKRELTDQNPDLVPRVDGAFHREPDFARDERPLAGLSTNITVNQLAACQNPYTASPLPACRILVGCPPRSPDICLTNQQSYFV